MRKPVSTAVHALLLLFIVGAIQTPGYSQSKKSSEDRAAKLVLDSVGNPRLNGETIRLDGSPRMAPK